jgi:hypothetical protein
MCIETKHFDEMMTVCHLRMHLHNKFWYLILKNILYCLTIVLGVKIGIQNFLFVNRTPCIRHLCRKTIVLSCQRYLINTGVEKMNNI